jgi:Ca2+-binding EF-hand superfamily protein
MNFVSIFQKLLRVIYNNMPLHNLNSDQKKFDLNFHESCIEINRLTLIFNKLCDNNKLTREYFRDFLSTIFDLNDEIIIERLFILIGQGEKTFSLKNFLSTINLLLYSSYDEQIKFIFRIYDVSADGNLQREELFTFLRKDLPIINDKEDADMILHEFITLIFKKFDKDQDGLISFDDYNRTCQENPTLIQCFGQVLPHVFRKHIVKSMLNGNLSKKEKYFK